jgi:hypothetical protein
MRSRVTMSRLIRDEAIPAPICSIACSARHRSGAAAIGENPTLGSGSSHRSHHLEDGLKYRKSGGGWSFFAGIKRSSELRK